MLVPQCAPVPCPERIRKKDNRQPKGGGWEDGTPPVSRGTNSSFGGYPFARSLCFSRLARGPPAAPKAVRLYVCVCTCRWARSSPTPSSTQMTCPAVPAKETATRSSRRPTARGGSPADALARRRHTHTHAHTWIHLCAGAGGAIAATGAARVHGFKLASDRLLLRRLLRHALRRQAQTGQGLPPGQPHTARAPSTLALSLRQP